MKSFPRIAIGLTLFMVVSCSSDTNKIPDSKTPENSISVGQNQQTAQLKENFEDFFRKFNTDSLFQKNRTQFPLKGTFQLDPINDNNDSTFYVNRKDYFFIKLTEPNNNIVDGITYVQITGRDNKRTVVLRMEDSGVHIEYTFLLKNGEWWFVGFYDTST